MSIRTKKPTVKIPGPAAMIGRLLRDCGLCEGRAFPKSAGWLASLDKEDRKARRKLRRVDDFLSRCFDHFPGIALDKESLLDDVSWSPAKLARFTKLPRAAGGGVRAVAAGAAGAPPAPAPPATGWVTAGLTKEQFLDRNDVRLMDLLGRVNAGLRARYGTGVKKVNREDLWVIFYCECGLRSGRVDPDHRHSEGERGLLPLPSNIRAWNGPSAPRWDRPMSVPVNLEHFFLYMGHLKNKDLTGAPRHLYRGLFQAPGIGGHTVKEAKVLAGVVHGYFYSGNYSDRTIPYDYLVRGYRDDTRLSVLMAATRYRHAGTAVMTGREANIDAALRLV